MLKFNPPTRAENHAAAAWVRDEAYRFYVQHRRENCTHRELLDLWLRVPYCGECIQSDTFFRGGPPEIIGGEGWEVSAAALQTINAARADDPEFSIRCKKCHCELRPWEGDDVYVRLIHVEEDFGMPLETPGRTTASEELRRKIVALYDRKCFGCGRTDRPLHLDHIVPRSAGGDAAFRNLQPLCESCGQEKGDTLPVGEVTVYSDMYFGPEPSDGYEGLFW